MTLTKADMAEMLFDQVGLNKREAKDMVEAFYYRVCTMAIEELNEFMKNKAKSNDN